MNNQPIFTPRLITVDNGAKAIHDRFRGWPDSILTASVMTQLISQPELLPEDISHRLLAQGILQREANSSLHCSLPIYEQLPLARWSEILQVAVRTNSPALQKSAGQLRERWGTQRKLPAWPEIAHSLLLGYLVWGCGSKLLLKLCQGEVLAVIVAAPGSSVGIWHDFIRSNQEYGSSALLGDLFTDSEQVQSLLSRPEVGQALHSLAGDRSLLVLHPQAVRILQRLAALVSDRADESGLHHLAWPVLDSAELGLVRGELQQVLLAFSALLQQAIPAVLAAPVTRELTWLQTGDLALAAFGLLARQLADVWSQADLLPPVVQPYLADLK